MPDAPDRGGLLGAIRGGAALKAVPDDEREKSASGGNNDLLAAIRGGAALRKVEPKEKEPAQFEDDGNVLNLIAKALLDRRAAIKTGPSSPRADGAADNEWDDELDW